MVKTISPLFYRLFTVVALCSLGFSNGLIAQIYDAELSNIHIADTVKFGTTVTITGTISNVGTTVLPANIQMYLETILSGYPIGLGQIAFDGFYLQTGFGNPELAAGESFNFSVEILINYPHFSPNQDFTVIIWPGENPALADDNPFNNIHIEPVYVIGDVAPSNVDLEASICDDQTLPFGFEGSNTALIGTEITAGNPPYALSLIHI